MFKKYQLKSYNFVLLLTLIITALYGIVVINSANSEYTVRQCVGFGVGLVIMVFISFVDYNWILKYYWLIYLINLVLLIAVKVAGKSSHGAARWLTIGGFQFQPSELSKLILILVTAKILSMYKDKINDWRFLLILAVVLGVPLLLIAAGPDLSTTIITFLILFTIVFCAGLSYRTIGIALLIVVPLLAGSLLYISNEDNKVFFLQDYQRERIMTFLYPDENDSGVYQQKYSVNAIGSGQLSGKGLDNDDPTSMKNANYIAEAHTDFIFAVIGEELGFVGCMAVIILLSTIVIECIITAVRAKNFAGRLICCGVAAYVGFQTFINLGVVTQILPNTGLPLPFFSYGLTSLWVLMMSMGVVLNVSLQRNVIKDDDIFAKDFKG
jgi:rod shape determining protein RodA